MAVKRIWAYNLPHGSIVNIDRAQVAIGYPIVGSGTVVYISANARKDNNSINTLLAAGSNNGTTTVLITIDPTTHALGVSDGASGSDFGRTPAVRDQNSVPVIMAVSNIDGVTPVEIYADPATGKLLIQST